jgi:hypothetical protein
MTIPNAPPIQTPVDVREKNLTRLATPWSQWFARVQNFFGIESTFTPTLTGLTVVNGTGGATYSGTYTKIGRIVFWNVVIAVTGTCTTASSAGTTNISNLPINAAVNSTCQAADGTSANLGTGLVTGTSAYLPTWTARNTNINISGWYST